MNSGLIKVAFLFPVVIVIVLWSYRPNDPVGTFIDVFYPIHIADDLSIDAEAAKHAPDTEDVASFYRLFTSNVSESIDVFSQPVPFCTNDERLELLKKKCGPINASLENLTRKESDKMLKNIFVDTNHKVLACLPPKSGCTTWKNILANNSGDDPLPHDFNMISVHYRNVLNKLGIVRLDRYNKTMRQYFVNNYYKFMIVRHPLERFRSAYINKLQSGTDRTMQKAIGQRILKIYRPHLSTERISTGKGVTISEFTKYLQDTHAENPHWNPIHDVCQPCVINYDRIVKTETLDHDNEYIILNHMKPYHRGLGTKANVVAGGHQSLSISPMGRRLEIYDNSSINDLLYLQEMFASDFEYFGYSWKYAEINGTYSIRSSCVNGALDRMCC